MSREALVIVGGYDDVRCKEDIKAMKTSPDDYTDEVWVMRKAP